MSFNPHMLRKSHFNFRIKPMPRKKYNFRKEKRTTNQKVITERREVRKIEKNRFFFTVNLKIHLHFYCIFAGPQQFLSLTHLLQMQLDLHYALDRVGCQSIQNTLIHPTCHYFIVHLLMGLLGSNYIFSRDQDSFFSKL